MENLSEAKWSRRCKYTLWTYLMRSWYQLRWRRNTKLRSLSLRVVVSSISPSGISVVRPKDDPFRSNRLWIRYSEQNKLPITMNRVCFPITNTQKSENKKPLWTKTTQICPHNTSPSGHQSVWHNALQRILSPGNFHTDIHVGNNLEAFLLAPIKRLPNLRFQSNCPTSNVTHWIIKVEWSLRKNNFQYANKAYRNAFITQLRQIFKINKTKVKREWQQTLTSDFLTVLIINLSSCVR